MAFDIFRKDSDREIKKQVISFRDGSRAIIRLTPSPSVLVTPSFSTTPSITPTISISNTPSITPSITVSETPSPTPSTSISNTPSITPSISISNTPSLTPSISLSNTPSLTPSITISETPSTTPSISISSTPSLTPSNTITPSLTPSISISNTPSITPTVSISNTASTTPSISVTATPSLTPSITLSVTNTPSITPSISLTPTNSVTPTITPSITPSSGGGIISDSLFVELDASNYTSGLWSDETGNGNNATINGATWLSDNGGIFDLDGSNDNISIPHTSNLSLNTSSQRTIQVWVKFDILPALNAQIPVFGKLSSNFNFDGYWGGLFSNGGVVRCVTNGGSIQRTSNSTLTITTDTWYLFTFISQITSTSNTTKVYINETEYITAAHGSDTYTETNPLYLGYIGSGISSPYLNGKIGACYFYTKGLSAAEVSTNFNATKTRYLNPSVSVTPTVSISNTPSISISNTPSITTSISVTPTPTVTPSITPSSGSGGNMYNLLSTAGKAAYDAASVNSFFSCSVDDYNAVFNGLSSTSKIGNTDVIFSTAVGSLYSGTCASVLPQANSTISANSYIVGFATKMITSLTTTVTPLISTTYKGTYTALSNSPTISGTARVYYLRKEPTITSTESYVGHVLATGNFDMTTTTYTNAGFDCSVPYSGWSNRTGTMPHFQMITTTVKPY